MSPRPLPCEGINISDEWLLDFLEIRALSGISDRVFQSVKRIIYNYVEFVNYKIDRRKTLKFFKNLKEEKSVSYYRKQGYQILKFLRYMDVKWMEEIKLPPESTYLPKHVPKEDIDFDKRCIKVNHNPNNGQSTKTKHSRITFFTENRKQILNDYIEYIDNSNNLTILFPKRWLEGKFRNTPIRVKHLRKYFSQEWDRRVGSTSIKKILMRL